MYRRPALKSSQEASKYQGFPGSGASFAGFALLQDDSSASIPLFRRGYRDELTVLKNRNNVLTQLDLNVDRLQDGLHKSRTLASAQFLPFYFSSLDEMRAAIQKFVATDGNPKEEQSHADKLAERIVQLGGVRDSEALLPGSSG